MTMVAHSGPIHIYRVYTRHTHTHTQIYLTLLHWRTFVNKNGWSNAGCPVDTSSWQSHPKRQSFPRFEIEKARVTSAIKRSAGPCVSCVYHDNSKVKHCSVTFYAPASSPARLRCPESYPVSSID